MVGCTNPGTAAPAFGTTIDFPKELFTPYELNHGAIAVHVISSIYVFYIMFIICNEYLVPAIEALCEALNLPSHIAGASFLAASSSIPELFVNIIGTFLTKDDLGIGTVMASAFFNILAIVALTGVGTAILGTNGRAGAKYNTIALCPLTRDSLAYTTALIALSIVVWDQKVYWYEALGLVLLYCLYIIVLTYNNVLERLGLRLYHMFECCTLPKKVDEKTPILGQMEQEPKSTEEEAREAETEDEKDKRTIEERDKQDLELIREALEKDSHDAEMETSRGKWTALYPPRNGSCFAWIPYILLLPARLLILMTVPDCREAPNRKWFPCTLMLSVIWVGTLSYLSSWMLTTFGSTLGFPNAITGIFLAFGASFPEILSSFIVARKGLGTMGLSNPIGSNTFDILICLGLPWTFQGFIKSRDYVQIQSGGVYITVYLLLASIFLLYAILVANRLVLDLKVALVALVIYIFMMTIVCLLEMNVFFTVNEVKSTLISC